MRQGQEPVSLSLLACIVKKRVAVQVTWNQCHRRREKKRKREREKVDLSSVNLNDLCFEGFNVSCQL